VPENLPSQVQPLNREEMLARLQQGQQWLERGQFRQAADGLTAVNAAWKQQPALLSGDEGRTLEHLARQASALADLSSESLEEILGHAAGSAELEWLADFPHRYLNKAILLDLELRAVGGKHYEHPYLLWAQGVPAHLDLDDLTLLGSLPLDPRQRVVFLARLASVRREPGRGWVVRLQADSGVLLTDAGAARICCPAFIGAEFQALLDRQALWVKTGGPSHRK
jgi:hypothetical protein